jgi:hypothetical protein
MIMDRSVSGQHTQARVTLDDTAPDAGVVPPTEDTLNLTTTYLGGKKRVDHCIGE